MTAAAHPRWVIVGFVVLAIGFAGGRASVRQQQTAATTPSGPATIRPLTEDSQDSTASAHTATRTREDAVVAATSYAVALDGPDLLLPSRRPQLIGRIATRDAREDLETKLGSVAELLVEHLGLTPAKIGDASSVWRSVPAGWRIVSYDGTDATVAIWGTGIAMVDGRLLAPVAWRTTFVDLTWQEGAWRLVGFRSEAGPEPPRPGDGRPERDVAAEIRRFSTFRFRPVAEGDS